MDIRERQRLRRGATWVALACVIMLLTPRVTLAGGVSVELDQQPTGLEAGVAFTVGFTIRSLHDARPPVTDVTPIVIATNRETKAIVQVEGKAEGQPGHYVATLTLPSAGEWSWQFQPYGREVVDYHVTMPSLEVRAPGSPALPAAAATGPLIDSKVRDSYFEPQALIVTAGSTVWWTNVGKIPHTVTADDGSFVSGNMNTGADFKFTFVTPGTYHYYCEYHGRKQAQAIGGVHGLLRPAVGGGFEMEGTIIVTAAPAGAAAPATTLNTVNSNAQPETVQAQPQDLPTTGRTDVPVAAWIVFATVLLVLGIGLRSRRTKIAG